MFEDEREPYCDHCGDRGCPKCDPDLFYEEKERMMREKEEKNVT